MADMDGYIKAGGRWDPGGGSVAEGCLGCLGGLLLLGVLGLIAVVTFNLGLWGPL